MGILVEISGDILVRIVMSYSRCSNYPRVTLCKEVSGDSSGDFRADLSGDFR